MYEYIKGHLVNCTESYAAIDVGGLAYRLQIPSGYVSRLAGHTGELTLYASFVVRENSHALYGFLTIQERDTFDVLIEISGVGPKLALAVVGAISIQDLIQAVNSGDVLTMSRIPGIGKKKAEKLILEVKSKLGKLPLGIDGGSLAVVNSSPIVSDAMNALMNLGYTRVAAQHAIENVQKDNPNIELAPLITEALRSV
ncbi:Holliday junction ATP-dependent DNA helicase RuvA [Chlamydiales bacterium SCGC AG-110-M15]|nr:Holliday junction ATP-dependent DNA helicase RuvA [Chlamydiales bacterium SCGC AG-110-M15]